MLINGQWAQDFHTRHETAEDGSFVREESKCRHWITPDVAPGPSGDGGFAAEAGRYHLYVALICPWASRKKANVAQKAPYAVDVEAGKTYYWCTCGHSKGQPFCDGSHQGTVFAPVVFTAEKSEKVYLCGCKQTRDQPFCDGAHHEL